MSLRDIEYTYEELTVKDFLDKAKIVFTLRDIAKVEEEVSRGIERYKKSLRGEEEEEDVRKPQKLTPIASLVESIARIGVKVPIIVDSDYNIIDGVVRTIILGKLYEAKLIQPKVKIPIIKVKNVKFDKSKLDVSVKLRVLSLIINRYRFGGKDTDFHRHALHSLILDSLRYLAMNFPEEAREWLDYVKSGKFFPRSLVRKLAQIIGYSERHAYRLLKSVYMTSTGPLDIEEAIEQGIRAAEFRKSPIVKTLTVEVQVDTRHHSEEQAIEVKVTEPKPTQQPQQQQQRESVTARLTQQVRAQMVRQERVEVEKKTPKIPLKVTEELASLPEKVRELILEAHEKYKLRAEELLFLARKYREIRRESESEYEAYDRYLKLFDAFIKAIELERLSHKVDFICYMHFKDRLEKIRNLFAEYMGNARVFDLFITSIIDRLFLDLYFTGKLRENDFVKFIKELKEALEMNDVDRLTELLYALIDMHSVR